jgi:tRNA (uracil-5-)-methyltransferase TRM9
MDQTLVNRLNQINRDFYRLTVQDFDESRGRPWAGWTRLLPYLAAFDAPIRVLDVGCGNGRFGRFLARNLDSSICYHGLDYTPALLDAARSAFAQMNILPDAILEERDIVERPPDAGQYDLVALFGVLHHVPGHAGRRALLRALAKRVAPGGLLVFTCWCFYEYERFRRRIIAWPADLSVEPGDYLLDWQRGHAANTALRYCHYVDATEHAALVTATGLDLIETFRADGHTDDINRYSLLRRNSAIPPSAANISSERPLIATPPVKEPGR